MNDSGSSRDTANVLSLEACLRGAVAPEVPAEWTRHAVRAVVEVLHVNARARRVVQEQLLHVLAGARNAADPDARHERRV